MGKIYKPKGYIEGSKKSKALDFLAGEGIDCIRIGQTTWRGNNTKEAMLDTSEGSLNTAYFPINMLKDRNFLDDIFNSNEGFVTDDGLRIEIDGMYGFAIKELNHKLSKLVAGKLYRVIKISYTDDGPTSIAMNKPYKVYLGYKNFAMVNEFLSSGLTEVMAGDVIHESMNTWGRYIPKLNAFS